MNDLEKIRDSLRKFASERDWDQFHTPKNLALALTAEVGELVEHFQWETAEQIAKFGPERKGEIADELADVLSYLVRLSDKMDIDLEKAFFQKIEKNSRKYPIEKAKGTAKKYTDL